MEVEAPQQPSKCPETKIYKLKSMHIVPVIYCSRKLRREGYISTSITYTRHERAIIGLRSGGKDYLPPVYNALKNV